jgi:hypothetical protein
MSRLGLLASIVLLLQLTARAATVTLTNADALGNSSFNTPGGWSNGLAPTNGNGYVVSILRIRTPASSGSFIFGGDSLSITGANGVMSYKGSGTTGVITVSNLILNGGGLDHLSSASDIFRLAGNLNIAGNSSIYAKQGPIIIQAMISGTGTITNPGADVAASILAISNSLNTFKGSIVNNGRLQLLDTANLNFVIGASNVNNSISGTGAATTFNGRFVFDLSGASTNTGDRWNIASASGQTFGSTFTVDGFVRTGGGPGPGTWQTITNGAQYSFDTSSGILQVAFTDTDGDGLPDSWEMQYFGNLAQGPNDDPDGDGFTNLQEYQAGTNPTNANSFPLTPVLPESLFIPVDDGDPSTSEYGYAGSSAINAVAFIATPLTTVSNQQFIAYYYRHQTNSVDTNNNRIVIARRNVNTNLWQVFHTTLTANDITDGHDVVAFGIDGEGYMHLSWGMHNAALNYAISTNPVSGNLPIGFGPNIPMTGQENSVTYPQFLTAPDGDLFYFFREGASGGGDNYLNRYVLATHSWTNVNAVGGTQQPFIKGLWPTDYNAYLNMPCIDPAGNLYLVWTWRDTPAYQSNHDFDYAQSFDGGLSWRQSNGSVYTLPINQNGENGDPNSIGQKIISIPTNSSLINQAGMCLDANTNPVIATWWAPGTPTNDFRRQYIVAFPDTNGAWQTRQISNRTNDPPGTLEQDAAVRDLGRPVVIADNSNRIIVLYRGNAGSNGLTVAWSLPYGIDPQRTNWTTMDLTTDNLGSYEPVIDLARWQRDNVLDILYQASSGEGYNPPADTASQIGVLEWNAAAWFTNRPSLKLTALNGGTNTFLKFLSQPGFGYHIQTSTDLNTWTNASTLTGTGGWMQFITTNAPTSKRFWRLELKEGGFAP